MIGLALEIFVSSIGLIISIETLPHFILRLCELCVIPLVETLFELSKILLRVAWFIEEMCHVI